MNRRQEVSFPSQGLTVRAWLYLPAGPQPPVIVMAHGLGAVKSMRLDAFADRFCEAGYACLVFDYRHFGDSEGQPRQLLDIDRQLQDWHAAMAYARSRPYLDTDRIVLWGTSFSGGHVIKAGAQDGRVAAVVSQCPFTDGLASTLTLGVVSAVKVSTLAILDTLGSLVGAKPITVALAGARGTAALMTAPDAAPGYQAIKPAGSAIPNEVAARVGLRIPLYYPGRSARQLVCPALFCVCDADSVAPAAATLRHVSRAPKGEVKRYAEGHFDIYAGPAFERVVSDQIDWLKRIVPVNGPV
jgi:dienelactone hydrolase